MCARYTATKDFSGLEAILAFVSRIGVFVPRYNIAPGQWAPVLVAEAGQPTLKLMRWGLLPAWMNGQTPSRKLINARAETAHIKPAFRRLVERQRCLVPADGFYEWRREGERAVPFHFSRKDGAVFCFAGLWDGCSSPAPPNDLERHPGAVQREAEPPTEETFLILTTAANEIVRPVHERMPVILSPEQFADWLMPDRLTTRSLSAWWKPPAAELFQSRRVSPHINNPRNEGPACLAPA